MEIDSLKKYCSKENLTEYEILWLNYAKNLGFDINLLNSTIKTKDNPPEYYSINGLIWKYSKVLNSSSQYFENNLYVVLQRTIYFTEEDISLIKETVEKASLIPNGTSNLVNNLVNTVSSTISNTLNNTNIPSTISSNTIPLSGIITGSAAYVAYNLAPSIAINSLEENSIYSKLEIEGNKVLNDEIKEQYLDGRRFCSLSDLINNYLKLDNSKIGENINIYPKFKIILEINK